MRRPPRRAGPAIQCSIRLCDTQTFARLCRARDYLGACYRDSITLEKSASQASLSPFYFSRLFTRAFGETPHEFVTRLRIEEAKRLLLREDQRVTDICFEVGYGSLGSFSLRFRSLTGFSPTAFRREARRTFGGLAAHWPRLYIPACYQRFFLESP
jgi:AraC-like DNA-binding protein